MRNIAGRPFEMDWETAGTQFKVESFSGLKEKHWTHFQPLFIWNDTILLDDNPS
jgi:hypothetical protein